MTAAIDEILRNGILFDVKNWGHPMPAGEIFAENISALFDTLAEREINYLLVGGVALLSYVEGRNTQDIDLIVARSDLADLPEIYIQEENKDFIRGTFEQLQVDILLTENKLFRQVLQEFATKRQFGGQVVRCVTVEGLVMLKCYALPSLYRQATFGRASLYENDILLLLLNYTVDLDMVLTLLSHHLIASDLSEIRNILDEIEGRIQRFSVQKQILTEE